MIALVFCFLLSTLLCDNTSASDSPQFSKEWVVEVIGGEEAARLVADVGGFELLGQVLPDSDLYHFKEKRVQKRSVDEAEIDLSGIANVKSFSHQTVHKVCSGCDRNIKLDNKNSVNPVLESQARFPGR